MNRRSAGKSLKDSPPARGPRSHALRTLAVISVASSLASAQARLVGNAGGAERAVRLFDRDHGEVWSTYTGPDGAFASCPVAPGHYMVISHGRVGEVRVRADRDTRIDWGPSPGLHADCETWSPARKSFGQTFVATGPFVRRLTFWLPGEPVRLRVEFRARGPDGPLIAHREFERPVSWIRNLDFRPGEWPTAEGGRYYLEIRSTDRSAFCIGTPALGDVYPDGEAFYDSRPVLDSDLGLSIEQDDDGLATSVYVSLHEGFGYVAEGPASGLSRQAAQTFVATTRNVIAAWANAGWGAEEGIRQDFLFSIHRSRPDGERVGPVRRTSMVKDWGATALWFPDQVRLEPGMTYALVIARADGRPFYAYLGPDLQPTGSAWREGLDTDSGFDLTCVVRGQEGPGSIARPFNVVVRRVEPDAVTWRWETAALTESRLLYKSGDLPWEVLVRAGKRGTHEMTIDGLKPGSEVAFRAAGLAGSHVIFSQERTVRTLEDPTWPVPPWTPAPPSEHERVVAVSNAGFEDGLECWIVSAPEERGEHGLPTDVGRLRAASDLGRFRPHSGAYAVGWRHRIDEHSGAVPRQLKPPVSRVLSRTVATRPGARYVLSAWVLTDERGGGWNRNDRVRLVADPRRGGGLKSVSDILETVATQWYTTRGRWHRCRLRFTAKSEESTIGVEFYQWWILRENNLWVDDVRLLEGR